MLGPVLRANDNKEGMEEDARVCVCVSQCGYKYIYRYNAPPQPRFAHSSLSILFLSHSLLRMRC